MAAQLGCVRAPVMILMMLGLLGVSPTARSKFEHCALLRVNESGTSTAIAKLSNFCMDESYLRNFQDMRHAADQIMFAANRDNGSDDNVKFKQHWRGMTDFRHGLVIGLFKKYLIDLAELDAVHKKTTIQHSGSRTFDFELRTPEVKEPLPVPYNSPEAVDFDVLHWSYVSDSQRALAVAHLRKLWNVNWWQSAKIGRIRLCLTIYFYVGEQEFQFIAAGLFSKVTGENYQFSKEPETVAYVLARGIAFDRAFNELDSDMFEWKKIVNPFLTIGRHVISADKSDHMVFVRHLGDNREGWLDKHFGEQHKTTSEESKENPKLSTKHSTSRASVVTNTEDVDEFCHSLKSSSTCRIAFVDHLSKESKEFASLWVDSELNGKTLNCQEHFATMAGVIDVVREGRVVKVTSQQRQSCASPRFIKYLLALDVDRVDFSSGLLHDQGDVPEENTVAFGLRGFDSLNRLLKDFGFYESPFEAILDNQKDKRDHHRRQLYGREWNFGAKHEDKVRYYLEVTFFGAPNMHPYSLVAVALVDRNLDELPEFVVPSQYIIRDYRHSTDWKADDEGDFLILNPEWSADVARTISRTFSDVGLEGYVDDAKADVHRQVLHLDKNTFGAWFEQKWPIEKKELSSEENSEGQLSSEENSEGQWPSEENSQGHSSPRMYKKAVAAGRQRGLKRKMKHRRRKRKNRTK